MTGPHFRSDEELCRSPILAVAHWEGAPRRAVTAPFRGSSTEVVVDEVLWGELEPGVHEILLATAIGWPARGGMVQSYSGTHLLGDVAQVADRNLWFLDRAPEGLVLGHYRAVQPLALADYFRALASDDPGGRVPSLLASGAPEVERRVLRYVNGGRLPGYRPSETFNRYFEPESRGPVLREHAPAVARLLERPGENRALAARVLAEVAGERSAPRMRALLDDAEPGVRAAAVVALCAWRDGASLGRFARAVEGVDEPYAASIVVEALAAWPGDDVLDALAWFLQGPAGPCFAAREALHARTGCWFPFDTAAGREALRRAEGAGEGERRAILAALGAAGECPLAAEFVDAEDVTRELAEARRRLEAHVAAQYDRYRAELPGEAEELCDPWAPRLLRVTNESPVPVQVARRPDLVGQRWSTETSGGSSSRTPFDDGAGERVVTLRPGASLCFWVPLLQRWLDVDPASRELRLEYREGGRAWGCANWRGTLRVRERVGQNIAGVQALV